MRHLYNDLRSKKSLQTGFTVVELIVVIIVIGILTSVVILSYNGYRDKVIENSLQSDLFAINSALESERQRLGSYPATAAQAQNGSGLPVTDSNVATYSPKPYGFCVSITRPGFSKTYSSRSSTKGSIQTGDCTARVTTVAGQDGSGAAFADGNGTSARLACMYGIATSSSGNLYVGSDSNLARIRKMTPSYDVSTVTTLWNTAPYCPNAQVVDSNENVYFTVYTPAYANQIWKVTPSGVVTSFAGTSTAGFANGQGSTARFSSPSGLAIDKNDTIYVADYGNRRIRTIDRLGNVSTIAGTGTAGYTNGAAASAQFTNLNVVAVDSKGVVYIGDSPYIRKLENGIVSNVAGNGTWGYVDGAVGGAQFNDVSFLAVDKNGVIYEADYDSAYIRKIIPNDTVSTVIGSTTYGHVDGSGTAARFRPITGVEFDQSGVLWVASGNTIRKVEL